MLAPTHRAQPRHNRWHPEAPPAVRVKPGDSFRVHCRECPTAPSRTRTLLRTFETSHWTASTYSRGPIAVEGLRRETWLAWTSSTSARSRERSPARWSAREGGCTDIFPTLNSGGFLTEQFPGANKAVWDFSGQTRHLPTTCLTSPSPGSSVRVSWERHPAPDCWHGGTPVRLRSSPLTPTEFPCSPSPTADHRYPRRPTPR